MRLLAALLVALGLAVLLTSAVAARRLTSGAAHLQGPPATVRLNPGATDPALATHDPSIFVVRQLFLAPVRPEEETGAALPLVWLGW